MLPFRPHFPLLLLFLPLLVHSSFVVDVGHRDEQCFIIRTPKGPEKFVITGTFDMLDGEKRRPHPLKVVILNDKLEHLYESKYATAQGDFHVIANGRLSLCVRNNMDSKASIDRYTRTVGVDVQVRARDASSELAEQIQTVQSKLWNAKTNMDYMRTRESMHREVKERTFTMLIVWSLVEAGCVVVASLLQIWYMRRFVEKRRY